MERKEFKAKVLNVIGQLCDIDKIELHNEYCISNKDYDAEIFETALIDDYLGGCQPSKILNLAFYGDFNPNHEYFKFNGYGNLESFDESQLDDYIYADEIADYLIDKGCGLLCKELADIFEELYDENEEEETELCTQSMPLA